MKPGEGNSIPPVVKVPSKRGEELSLTNETGQKFFFWSEALGDYRIGPFKFEVTEHFMLRYLERFSPKKSPNRDKIASVLNELVQNGWLLDERMVRSGETMRTHKEPGFYLANRQYIVSFVVRDEVCVIRTIYKSGSSIWYQNWLRFTEKRYRERAQTSRALKLALDKGKKELACG